MATVRLRFESGTSVVYRDVVLPGAASRSASTTAGGVIAAAGQRSASTSARGTVGVLGDGVQEIDFLSLRVIDPGTEVEFLTRIGADGWLTKVEKPMVIAQWIAIRDGAPALIAKGNAVGANDETLNFSTAVDALAYGLSLLVPSYDDTTQDSRIPQGSEGWRQLWAAIFQTQAALLAAIAEYVGKQASSLRPFVFYNFGAGGNAGWTAANCTGSDVEYGTARRFTADTGTTWDPQLSITEIALDPAKGYVIGVRLRKVTDNPDDWQGALYFTQAGHPAFTEQYKADIPRPLVGDWTTHLIDMRSLSTGSMYMGGGPITGLRFDFHKFTGSQIDIDWIAVGTYGSVAQSDVDELIEEIDHIGSDAWLSKGEKPDVIAKRNAIWNGRLDLYTAAQNVGVSYATYQAAVEGGTGDGTPSAELGPYPWQGLEPYLLSLSPPYTDKDVDTPINADAWLKAWTRVYQSQASLLAAIAQVQPEATPGGGANLVRNSSFEYDEEAPSGLADGFAVYNGDAGSVTYSRVAGGMYGGVAQRVQWATTTSSTRGVYSTVGTTWRGTPCGVIGGWRKDVSYVVSVFARASGTNVGKYMGLGWNIGQAPNTVREVLANPPLTSDWQRYIWRVQFSFVPANEFFISISGVSGFDWGAAPNSTGTLDFDCVQIEEGTVATPWKEAASDAAGLAAKAFTMANGRNRIFYTEPPNDRPDSAQWGYANGASLLQNDLWFAHVQTTKNVWDGVNWVSQPEWKYEAKRWDVDGFGLELGWRPTPMLLSIVAGEISAGQINVNHLNVNSINSAGVLKITTATQFSCAIPINATTGLGALAQRSSINYSSTDIYNKPTLGSFAAKNTSELQALFDSNVTTINGGKLSTGSVSAGAIESILLQSQKAVIGGRDFSTIGHVFGLLTVRMSGHLEIANKNASKAWGTYTDMAGHAIPGYFIAISDAGSGRGYSVSTSAQYEGPLVMKAIYNPDYTEVWGTVQAQIFYQYGYSSGGVYYKGVYVGLWHPASGMWLTADEFNANAALQNAQLSVVCMAPYIYGV